MKEDRIPARELWPALAATLAVRYFYTFLRAAALAAATAAPWAAVAAGALAWALFAPVVAALARRPGRNVVHLALAAGGRPLAVTLALLATPLLVVGTGVGLRQAAEVAVTGFFPHTPQTFALTTLVAAGALGAAASPAGLVWMGTVAFWPTMVALLLILVGNLGWGQFRNALPPLGHGLVPTLAQVPFLTSYWGELLYLAVVSDRVADPAQLGRAAGWAAALSTLSGAALCLIYLMVFPLPGGLAFPFPLLEMTRLVTGGRFLERVDALWIGGWVLGSAGMAAGALQTAALLFAGAFRLPHHREAVWPLAAATLAAALLPANQEAAIALEISTVRRWGFLITLVLPLAVAVLAGRRGMPGG